MKINFFGNEIEVGWNHVSVVIIAVFLAGILTVGLNLLLEQITYVNDIYGLDIIQYIEWLKTIIFSVTIPIFAVVLFLIGKYMLKGIDKNKIKSLCAAYAIVSFAVLVILALVLHIILNYAILYYSGYFFTERIMASITNTLEIITGSALLYLWLVIFNEWNRKKITNAVKNALRLAAITSILVSVFWYLYAWNLRLSLNDLGVYHSILANFISLSFMIVPVVYYLLDKKTIGNVEYFFAGIFVLNRIIEYIIDLNIYGRLFGLVALIIVYIWWAQQKKK